MQIPKPRRRDSTPGPGRPGREGPRPAWRLRVPVWVRLLVISAAAALWQGKGIVAKPHLQNWLDCMASRKAPNATEVDGHYSAMACHIGNLAYQKNECIGWNKEWDV